MNIPFTIGLIVVTLAMIFATVLVFHNKNKKNKVRFYITRYNGRFKLLIQDNYGNVLHICDDFRFKVFDLKVEDFKDLKNNERREVFLNLKD